MGQGVDGVAPPTQPVVQPVVVAAVAAGTMVVCGALLGLAAGLFGGLALPVLYAAAVLLAWLAAYILWVRWKVLGDAWLRWAAWGFAMAGAAALVEALAAPDFLAGDRRLAVSATGLAASRLAGAVALTAFALGAVARPHAAAAWRVGLAGLLAAWLGINIWEPAALGLPALAAADGYTLLYRALVTAGGLLSAATAVLWLRAPRSVGWSHAWVALALALAAGDLLLRAVADGPMSAAWWGSQTLWLAQAAAPAVGLMAGLPALLAALHRHQQWLSARLDAELAAAREVHAPPDGVDPQVVDEVRSVLDEGAFHPVFQPIYRLADDTIVGFEALTRFSADPHRPPNEWFDLAARAGLGVELEMAAARTAVAHFPRLPADTYLAVNVSPNTLASGLLEPLCDPLPADRLVFEVTEHEAIDDYHQLTEALRVLRARGARLAVDDAGAGFASMRHIVRTSPEIIKLDVSLVRDIHLDPLRRSLAASLGTFAAEVGCALIAEGIETDEEHATLIALGVPFGQGYHLTRPAPLLELLPTITQRANTGRPIS